jgi:hypothetical protein
MKSERMVIKSAELVGRIVRDYESLREFQRHVNGVVSISTLSNWTKERPPDKPWEAFRDKVAAVAEALGCTVEDIASYPSAKPARLSSRFALQMALGGLSEQWMLDVHGDQLSMQDRDATTPKLRGSVLTAVDEHLTGHLRVYPAFVARREGESALLPEEISLHAKTFGDRISGTCIVRNRRGDIVVVVFEGYRNRDSIPYV